MTSDFTSTTTHLGPTAVPSNLPYCNASDPHDCRWIVQPVSDFTEDGFAHDVALFRERHPGYHVRTTILDASSVRWLARRGSGNAKQLCVKDLATSSWEALNVYMDETDGPFVLLHRYKPGSLPSGVQGTTSETGGSQRAPGSSDAQGPDLQPEAASEMGVTHTASVPEHRKSAFIAFVTDP